MFVAVAILLTGSVFLPSALDPVNVPKLTALLVCALAAIAALAVATIRDRTISLPSGAPAASAAALLGAFVIATLTAPYVTPAVLGSPGRNSGLLAYAAAVSLYVIVLAVFTAESAALIAVAVLITGSLTATYGLLQRLGIDPIAWSNPFNPIIASLGNPDFASGYLGITVPIAAWAALRQRWRSEWRVAAALAGALCLGVAMLSHSIQGPLAAVAGLAVVSVGVVLNLGLRQRRTGLSALAGVALTAVAVTALGFRGVGPARSLFSGVAFDARACYWRGALSMWRSHPLTGVGLDTFGLYWRQQQPNYCASLLGPGNYTDAAHSVPLQHLAQGGLVLAVAETFFSAVVIIALVRGLRELRDQDRLLLAGLAGSWVAYRVQASVSIDQVPLLVLDYVLGAAVVSTSGRLRLKTVRLPGALPPVEPARGRGKRQTVARQRRLNGVDAALLTGVLATALILAWFAVTPLRASRAALRGDIALAAGRGDEAATAYRQAISLEPGVGVYRSQLARLYAQAHRDAQAVPLYLEAFRVDPTQISAARTAASLAEAGGNLVLARRMFTAAVQADPKDSTVIQEYANFERRHGGNAAARRRLNQAVRVLPTDADLWALLGVVRFDLADRPGARLAWDRALALKPDQPAALDGIKALSTPHG